MQVCTCPNPIVIEANTTKCCKLCGHWWEPKHGSHHPDSSCEPQASPTAEELDRAAAKERARQNFEFSMKHANLVGYADYGKEPLQHTSPRYHANMAAMQRRTKKRRAKNKAARKARRQR